MVRKIGFLVLLAFTTGVLYWSDLVIYGLRQLQGQLHIVNNAVEFKDVLNDPEVPDSIKSKLLFIEEVKRFAQDSLGLADSKNYTTFYDQRGVPAIWVITACEPFALTAYEWQFPFLGNVSYKGFFKKELGYPELDKLRKQGYDTDYNPAGGWSTLGFFRDPVLSGMLRRNKGQLAELIIHELTHATVYKKGQVDFNENLATFVGEQGAKQFLQFRFGADSPELERYENELQDEELFGNFMVAACKELDGFYDSLPTTLTTQQKYLAKYRKIASIVSRINSLPLKNSQRYRFNLPEDPLPDNTFFMGYQRYRGNLRELDKIYVKNGSSIRKMILEVKQ
jgi:predicted aminopeptidase